MLGRKQAQPWLTIPRFRVDARGVCVVTGGRCRSSAPKHRERGGKKKTKKGRHGRQKMQHVSPRVHFSISAQTSTRPWNPSNHLSQLLFYRRIILTSQLHQALT